jgi:hypothetical protein
MEIYGSLIKKGIIASTLPSEPRGTLLSRERVSERPPEVLAHSTDN